ncbi:competence/damage-inducible protein cinA [Thalassoporum mexicanum PCC 7367]|uniref:competence/damage-inducible protein A n=1 Tax=Thalassoporum mexicanum TaxID=3457544 RepID=UPI00029FB748|nr:competence/damage-inducible protein A [Pseudanabaena sp. PCC 7367]AFY71583.1 competence/damage-inducible protein cinA [Pseudanabaena sp. PCC 7367]
MNAAIAEIICVGTELLLGEILNSNSQYLAQQLATLGITHHYQNVVGDNKERLQKTLAIAAGRANLIIFTGGLGPTPDDLTTEAIAEFFDVPLVEQPEVWADIQRKYASIGRQVTANNRKQALLPQGAEILPNPIGSAPGMIWQPTPGLLILTFPGVPAEMQIMWQQTAVDLLRSQRLSTETFFSRVLLYWGISESQLAEQVQHLFASQNPTLAPYANFGQARLRITARAENQAAAEKLIEPVQAEILSLTGEYCYGNDHDTLASVVGKLLIQHNQTLAVAESCTGGWLGQMLTEVPGSSAYFLGGIISYSNAVKADLLNVNRDDLDRYGAVSTQVAEQMAIGVKQKLQSNWGISITGIAGPDGGSAQKPVGLVYIGLADPEGNVDAIEARFSPSKGRNWVRKLSAYSALARLRKRFVMIGV